MINFKVFESLLNDNISELIGADFYQSIPNANIVQNEDRYEFTLACPGLDKSDFNINVEDNYLKISANKSNETSNLKYKRREFDYSSFMRKFYLPEDLKISSIKATYENGILQISAEKLKKVTETNQILIS